MGQVRVFFSHSSKDNAFGQRLVADLRRFLGEEAIWYDASGGLHGGDEWWNQIVAEITAREVFVVLLSPDAIASDWVPREMGIAYWQHVKQGKRLLPLYYRPCTVPGDWEMIQSLPFTEDIAYENRLARLLGELGVTAAPARLALEHIERTLLEHPQDVPTLRAKAQALLQMGQLEDAAQVLDQAEGYVPTADVAAHLSLAVDRLEILRQQQQWDKALGLINEAQRAAPYDVLWPVRRLDLLLEAQRTADAQALATTLQAQAPAVMRQAETSATAMPPTTITAFWLALARAVAATRNPLAALALAREADRLGVEATTKDAMWKLWQSFISPDRLLLTYTGHTEEVNSVAWSLEGQRLASASDDKTVQVWDATDGRPLLIYRGHTDGVTSVMWSPEGQRLASAGRDGTVQIWNAIDGRPLLTYTGQSSVVYSVAWSPDGQRLASGSASRDKTMQVWSAANGRILLNYTGHTDWVRSVAWSPDGQRVASASSDKTVQVWNATDGRTLLIYRGHTDRVRSVAWSPDGQRLVSSAGDDTVQVWSAIDGRLLLTYKGHRLGALSLVWSPDGQRITSAGSDNTQVWNAADGRLLFTYKQHTNAVTSALWSPDGQRLATASMDHTVKVSF